MVACWQGRAIVQCVNSHAQLERTNAALLEALRRIERWDMPETGMSRDDGTPMRYGAVFGANGERDVIRNAAHAAIAEAESQKEQS